MFAGYTFEVEFTRNVFKVLRDRHVEEYIKLRIVRDIIKLASGEWENHLCKPLEHTSPTLRLYESKISKGEPRKQLIIVLCCFGFFLRGVSATVC